MLREAERRRHARIGDRHDDVGFDRRLSREFRAHHLANIVYGLAVHDRIRPGEINIFEDAGARGPRRKWLQAVDPFAGDNDDLAISDIAHKTRADDVERAGFRGENVASVELAKDERPDSQWIAGADQLLVAKRNERISSLDRAQGLDEPVDEVQTPAAGNEMKDSLGVGGRLIDRAALHKIVAQRQPIGEIAIVRDGEPARIKFGEKRLNIAQNGLARRRITHVPDGRPAGQPLDRRCLGEMIADKTKSALGIESLTVEGHDSRGLLAAML